ncbi:uncharacterized protein LOC127001433 [Eriocheir sinensis]|uniref:uncharacterized protein LOC127001433 n=1 Tax=Eriocheir sinensis TaxID=95602 RepID=UPI0021C8840D|nr:uncharacterized protein LOC127001433 [Eriocheir sinensis]
MNNRKKGRKKIHNDSLIDGLMTFNKLTTCHGPRHVLRNRGTCFGILWATVTLLLFVGLIVICLMLIEGFFQRDVQSQTTMVMAQVTGLPLPSLIVCNRGFFSKQKMESILVNATRCCEEFQPVKTMSGLCFQRIAGPNDRQAMVGEYSGFSIYTRLFKYDLMKFTPEMIDVTQLVKAGVQVTVTSNLTFPGFMVLGQGTILTANELTSISISLTQVDRTQVKTYIDVSEPSCVNAETLDFNKDIDSFLSTSVSCSDGGYMKCYTHICDCYSYSYTMRTNEQTKICSINETITCNMHLVNEISKKFRLNFTVGQYDFDENLSNRIRSCLTQAMDSCKPVCVELTYSHDSEVSPLRTELLRSLYSDFGLDEEC